jgi:hypothetical protein
MPRHHALAAAAVLVLTLAACGDDDTATDATTTTATTDVPQDTVPVVPLEDACELVADAAEVSGLPLAEPFTDGDERRRVCVFTPAVEGDVPLTVGVQAGSRFDEKAEQSEAATGPGEPVDGLGDEALFFYDDTDIPEGVGGVLVAVGDLTIDITVQGVDEATAREAVVAIARAAVGRL